MTSNYSTIDVKKENNGVKYVKVIFKILSISITLYHTYQLLYCKGQIQMTSIYNTIDVETEINRVKNC